MKFSGNTQTVLMKKTRLTVIKLEILNRSEKRQSLSFIPDSLARCLNDMNYLTFVEIFPTFIDVLKTRVEALKTVKIQKEKSLNQNLFPHFKSHFRAIKLTL